MIIQGIANIWFLDIVISTCSSISYVNGLFYVHAYIFSAISVYRLLSASNIIISIISSYSIAA